MDDTHYNALETQTHFIFETFLPVGELKAWNGLLFEAPNQDQRPIVEKRYSADEVIEIFLDRR